MNRCHKAVKALQLLNIPAKFVDGCPSRFTSEYSRFNYTGLAWQAHVWLTYGGGAAAKIQGSDAV